LYDQLKEQIAARKIDVALKPTGCFGFCAEEALVNVYQPGKPMLIYSRVEPKDLPRILDSLSTGKRNAKKVLCRIDAWDHHTTYIEYGKGFEKIPHWNELPFFRGQQKIVLRNAGMINPESIEDYIAVGGYKALEKVLLSSRPQDVVDEVI